MTQDRTVHIKEAERNNLINFTVDELAEARRKREA